MLRVPLASGADLYILTEGVYGSMNFELHDVIDVELVSDSHGPNGGLVPWQTPTSSDPAVLTPDDPVGLPPCPDWATCTAFTAATMGVAKLLIIGPMGILCDDTGSNCAAVAPIAYPITIAVIPHQVAPPTPSASSPPPSTNPPMPPTPTPTPQPTAYVSPTGSPPQVVLTDADESRTIEVPLGTLIVINDHSPPKPDFTVRPAVSTTRPCCNRSTLDRRGIGPVPSPNTGRPPSANPSRPPTRPSQRAARRARPSLSVLRSSWCHIDPDCRVDAAPFDAAGGAEYRTVHVGVDFVASRSS
ncbi:MAG TPA: hypothetical protein VIJ96_07025 [Acidothermaceae bacterium]